MYSRCHSLSVTQKCLKWVIPYQVLTRVTFKCFDKMPNFLRSLLSLSTMLLRFVSLLCFLNSALGEVYKCEIVGSQCFLRKITVSRDDFRFEPVADNPETITQVVVEKSFIPVFGPDICNTFRNLTNLEVRASSIQELHESAFANCSRLFRLAIFNQAIWKLPDTVFHPLFQLLQLELINIGLEELNESHFSKMTALWTLKLDGNKLTEVPSKIFARNGEVQTLSLASNELSDFKISEVLESLDHLKEIQLNDNDFSCRRVRGILESLREVGVRHNVTKATRSRYYKTKTVGGLECLTESDWSSVYYSKVGLLLTERVTSSVAALQEELSELKSAVVRLMQQK